MIRNFTSGTVRFKAFGTIDHSALSILSFNDLAKLAERVGTPCEVPFYLEVLIEKKLIIALEVFF